MAATDNSTRSLRRFPLMALVAAAGGLAALAAVLMTGDRMLVSQFDTAFDDRTPRLTETVAVASRDEDRKRPATVPIAAPESFWLGDVRNAPATLAHYTKARQPSPGDEVALSFSGAERRLQIVSVKSVSDNPELASLLGASTTSLRLLTLRETAPNANKRIILLIDEAGDILGGNPAGAHAL